VGNAAAIGREIRADLSKTIADSMITGTLAVIAATPVDTENASNNWMLTAGSPYEGVDGSRESPSSSVRDSLIEKMRDYDLVRDGTVYLRNNVFYLQFLDDGWSQQAPPGFVALAFASGARRAAMGRRASVHKMMTNMSRHAYLRTL